MAIDSALETYNLRRAEQDLLENTLRGSITVLVDLLALANPVAFGRAERLHHYTMHALEKLQLPNGWKYETAALLSQIGLVALPADTLDRVASGETLTPGEQRMFEQHADLADELVGKIPRLEGIAAMISRRGKPAPGDDEEITTGTRLLSIVSRFDQLLTTGASREDALNTIRKEQDREGIRALHALKDAALMGDGHKRRRVAVTGMCLGMVLDEDVRSTSGVLIVSKGQRANAGMLARLRNYAELGTINDQVHVLMPPKEAKAAA